MTEPSSPTDQATPSTTGAATADPDATADAPPDSGRNAQKTGTLPRWLMWPATPAGEPSPNVDRRVAGARQRRARHRAAAGFGRVDRANRITLSVFGVLVAAAGAFALLSAGGVFGWDQPRQIYRHLSRNAIGHPDLSAGVGSFVCLVLVVLGLWWAARQFVANRDRHRLGTVTLGPTAQGRTTLEASAVASAAAADLAAGRGIQRARVRLQSLNPPQLVANVDIGTDVDMALLDRAVDGPLIRVAQALGVDDIDAELRVRFVDRPSTGRVQ